MSIAVDVAHSWCLQGALELLRVLQDPASTARHQASQMCLWNECMFWPHLRHELASVNVERNHCNRGYILARGVGPPWRMRVVATCTHGPFYCHPRRSFTLVSQICSGPSRGFLKHGSTALVPWQVPVLQ